MRIAMKVFFMVGNITAWFSQAIVDGKITASECFSLLMIVLSGLGIKTEFNVTELRDAMLKLDEGDLATDNPEDAIDITALMNRM